MSDDILLTRELNEEFDNVFNVEDERDRRAIDEEDDDDFLQELDLLAQEVKREYENARFRYSNNNLKYAKWKKISHYEIYVHTVDDIYFRNAYGNRTRITNTGDDKDNAEDILTVNYLEQVSGYSINDFDPILDKVVKGRLNVDDVIKRHRRVRRSVTKKDTVEHVTKVMEEIEEELDDLNVIFHKVVLLYIWT